MLKVSSLQLQLKYSVYDHATKLKPLVLLLNTELTVKHSNAAHGAHFSVPKTTIRSKKQCVYKRELPWHGVEYCTLMHLFGFGQLTVHNITKQFCTTACPHLQELHLNFHADRVMWQTASCPVSLCSHSRASMKMWLLVQKMYGCVNGERMQVLPMSITKLHANTNDWQPYPN